MEDLQLLLILQRIAIGGTAIAGFGYLLFPKLLNKLVLSNKRRWFDVRAIVWVAAAFALGYFVEDMSKSVIDHNRGVTFLPFPWPGTTVDEAANRLINPIFADDQTERFNVLFTQYPGGEWYLQPLGAETLLTVCSADGGDIVTKLEKKYLGALSDTFSKDLRSQPIANSLQQELTRLIENEHRADLAAIDCNIRRDTTFRRSVEVAKTVVNEIYYQANNRVMAEPELGRELTGIQERLKFFRAVGFLAECFLLCYAFKALGQNEYTRSWAISLLICVTVFSYWLMVGRPQWLFTIENIVKFLVPLILSGAMLAVGRYIQSTFFSAPSPIPVCPLGRRCVTAVCKNIAYWAAITIPSLLPIVFGGWLATEMLLGHGEASKMSVENGLTENWGLFHLAVGITWLLFFGLILQRIVSAQKIPDDKIEAGAEQSAEAAVDKKQEERPLTGDVHYMIAVVSFVALILCSVGAHDESAEYNRRAFGYFVSLAAHGVGHEQQQSASSIAAGK